MEEVRHKWPGNNLPRHHNLRRWAPTRFDKMCISSQALLSPYILAIDPEKNCFQLM